MPTPEPNDERGVPRARINEPDKHTNPEDTLLHDAAPGVRRATSQSPSTGGKGPAISWLLVVGVLAVLVLLVYGGIAGR